MIKNNYGSSLISYVIILPLLLILVLAIIDFGLIIYYKNDAVNAATTISLKYQEYQSYDNLKEYVPNGFSLEIIKDENNTYIDINREYEFITPLAHYIFDDYKIEVRKKV